MLYFRDRDNILALARIGGGVDVNGSKCSFYPDYFVEVQKLRGQYMEVKRQLRNFKIPYAMLYPNKLRIVVKGQTMFFDNSKTAASWMDRNVQHLQPQRNNAST